MTAPALQDGGELISAHLLGDSTAFARLDALYRPRLIRFVDRMVRDRARAEDLVQETFLRVYRNGNRYDPARKFSTWIYTIAGNLARNDLRRRRRSPFVAWAGHGDSRFAIDQTDSALDPRPRPDDEATAQRVPRPRNAASNSAAPGLIGKSGRASPTARSSCSAAVTGAAACW